MTQRERMSDVSSFTEGREIKVQGRIVRGLRGHVIKSTLSFFVFFVDSQRISVC